MEILQNFGGESSRQHAAENETFEELVSVILRWCSGTGKQQRHCIGGLEVIMTGTVVVAVFWDITSRTDISNDYFATIIRVEIINNLHPHSTLQRQANNGR